MGFPEDGPSSNNRGVAVSGVSPVLKVLLIAPNNVCFAVAKKHLCRDMLPGMLESWGQIMLRDS